MFEDEIKLKIKKHSNSLNHGGHFCQNIGNIWLKKWLIFLLFPWKEKQWCQCRSIFWTLYSNLTRMMGNKIILICHKSKKKPKYCYLSKYLCHGGHFGPNIIQIGCPDFGKILNYLTFHDNMPYFDENIWLSKAYSNFINIQFQL